MAGSVNKALLVGRVGADPEIKSMNSGDRVANFSLATSERWKEKSSGEQKEKTFWHRIVVWDQNLIRVIESYVKKGALLYLEGQIETRKYEKDGVDHYTTEVVLRPFRSTLTMLDSRKDGPSAHDTAKADGYQP